MSLISVNEARQEVKIVAHPSGVLVIEVDGKRVYTVRLVEGCQLDLNVDGLFRQKGRRGDY